MMIHVTAANITVTIIVHNTFFTWKFIAWH